MLDQRLVVVAPAVGDTSYSQPILVDLLIESDRVALVWQHLANHLETDLMVIFFHLVDKFLAPEAARAGLHIYPFNRQRALCHPAITAGEILTVVIVPVLSK